MSTHHARDAVGAPRLDLRAEAEARQAGLGALPSLTGDEREAAIRTWRGRMVNEHISARVWSSLVGQLMAATAPPSLIAGAATAAADELRHAEQCASVVLALGGNPVAPLPELPPIPAHEDAAPLEAAVRNLVSVGCLSETVAVSIIRAEQAELEGTALGEVLESILADEVAHARLGWRGLGLLFPSLDAPARQRMQAYLADALAHQVEHEVPLLGGSGPRSSALRQSGVCEGEFARALFLDTIEGVIVPGLGRAGLDGEAAWREARSRTAALVAACGAGA